MVWYFIGVYIINGRLEIRNFSSSVENIFQHSKRNFVSPSGHVISSLYGLISEYSVVETYPKGRRLRYVKPARPLYCNAAQGDIRWQRDRSLSLLLEPFCKFCNSLAWVSGLPMILKQELTNLTSIEGKTEQWLPRFGWSLLLLPKGKRCLYLSSLYYLRANRAEVNAHK